MSCAQLDMLSTTVHGAAVVREVPPATASSIWAPEVPAQVEREEQRRQLTRVSGALAERIRLFLTSCLATGGTFYASELHAAVGGAPASADRVLRMLRNAGEVTYRVERSSSLYTIETLSHIEAAR